MALVWCVSLARNCGDLSIQPQALVDSGPEDTCSDKELAEKHRLPLEPWSTPVSANALNGNIQAEVTHHMAPIAVTLSSNHTGLPNSKPFTFTPAPILIQPDPELQFVVEVDASDTGVGAVLSLFRFKINQIKDFTRAFFSRNLTAADRNDDVGDRELLAVKIKNLAYIQSAKWLNFCQARWSLFLSWFFLTLTYRPRSRKVKPVAFSRQHTVDETSSEPKTFLPSTCVVSMVTWGTVERAHRHQPDHGNGSLNRLFVCSQVLQWAHRSFYPGVNRALKVLQKHFWWPKMGADTLYVSTCSVWVQGKASHLLVSLDCYPCLATPGHTLHLT